MHKFHDKSNLQLDDTRIFGMCLWYGCSFFRFVLNIFLMLRSPHAHRLLIDDSIVHLPRHISPPYRHHNIVMMRQVPTQTNVLRVLVRTQVTGESTLSAALKAHVSCQVVL